MENLLWKQNVTDIKKAIWVYTICGLLSSLFAGINAVINPMNITAMLAMLSGDGEVAAASSVWATLSTVCSLLVIVGYVWFFILIDKFSKIQINEADAKAAGKLKTANILFVVAILVDFIPLIGWLIWLVLMIVAYVKLYQGYAGLSHSEVLPDGAKSGANLLRVCVIWTIVAAFIVIIPLLGSFISLVISLVVFFKVLQGWTMIAEGAPEVYDSNEVK